MRLLRLARAELGGDVAAEPDTNALPGQDAGRAGDVTLLQGFRLRRLVAVALRGQLRRRGGSRAEKGDHKSERDLSLHDHELPSRSRPRDTVAELLPHECS